MLKYFICPDGQKRAITECLEKCPRPSGRRLSLPTLYELGNNRPWNGKTSTTMLLNPTRQEYLKITKDYAIIPQERAFALLGSRHHYRLDIMAKKIAELQSEKKAENVINTGTLDLLEPDELNEGKWKLIDYKTWGAFSVVKILDKDSYERYSASLQLNDYRIMVEPLGFEVSRMLWQITVRDGGTKTFREHKLDNKMPMVEADLIDNDAVLDYFYQKNKALMDALAKQELPPLCSFDERWHGRRCAGNLCEVHMFCPEGSKINRVKLEK